MLTNGLETIVGMLASPSFSVSSTQTSIWVVIAALIVAIFFPAVPAMAEVNHESAFNLCVAQPMLQAEKLTPIIEEKLSKPHDPAMDGMSLDRILNALQYTIGNICAAKLVSHPDVFFAIAAQQFMSPDGWRDAWAAFNVYCRRNLTRACIQQEVEAGAAILKANTQDGGPTVSSRVCLLVMSRDMDSVQWKRCMDAVGKEQASDEVILTCATAIQWHSKKDGALAGRRIRKCFEKGG